MVVTTEQLCFDKELLNMIKVNNEAGNIEVYYIIKNKNLHRFSDNAGNTLLHFASKYHNVELIQDLIDAGSEVNIQNFEGKTPIILALEKNHDARMTASQVQSLEILCEANADIDIIDHYGKSAANLVFDDKKFTYKPIFKLFFYVIEQQCMNNNELIAKKLLGLGCSLEQAIFLKNAEVIEHMIRNGCPVDGNHPNAGQTALHLAVSFMDLESVKVLIKYNADVTLKDIVGYTPLSYYGYFLKLDEIQYPEIVQLLLNKLVASNVCNKNRFLELQTRNVLEFGNKKAIQILLQSSNNTLFSGNNLQQTPLHFLARNYNQDIFEILELLPQKYDVNLPDYSGDTPLHYAVTHYCSHENVFKFLLKNGANVNAKNADEYVPLFLLCKNNVVLEKNFRKIVNLLIQYGMDIQSFGPNELTVFDIIIQNKLFYKAKPLLAHLAILEGQDHLKEHIRHKINSHSMLKNYFSFCKQTLKKMKYKSINRKLTLYSFLVESDEKIIQSCKLEGNALFKFERLTKKRSNYYYNIIQTRILKIAMILELVRKSRLIIRNLLKIIDDPNHVVVTEIIYYLNYEDLKNLCLIDM